MEDVFNALADITRPDLPAIKKLNIRCSSIGFIMTDPRNKTEVISETAKTHLIDLFVADKYDRHSDTFNKYIDKGLQVEEDSITLFSRVKKRFFKKNEERIVNDFINGVPDLFEGLEIRAADIIIDIKSSWDLYTFFRAKHSPVNKQYWWQLQGYMALTGASKALLAYCLVNTPEVNINDEKRRLMYRMGVATDENPDFIQACEEIDRNMRYDDIPMADRVHEFEVLRDDKAIEQMYERIKKCRDYYERTFFGAGTLAAV